MTKKEFIEKREALKADLAQAEGAAYDAKMREIQNLTSDFNAETATMEREAVKSTKKVDSNKQLREVVNKVRTREIDGTITLAREDSQAIISSAAAQAGDYNNMESAGFPLTIGDLINPLEMGLIYDKLGIKVATGVRGQLQWPCLDSAIEVSVGGELDDAAQKTLDFSKVTVVPVKLGVSVEVSNEAINDASFDLRGTIINEINRGFGRTLNNRVLALSAPSAKAGFCGPLVSKAQSATYAYATPTYGELKAAKGKVLATGADMAGFCYVMDAAMYSALEAEPKDLGSGRFIIENGKIDGDPVFITNISDYSGKVAAGCFGYEAINQHGEVNFIVDPYTKAKKNVTVFTCNADFSLTLLLSGSESAYPFVVLASAGAES